MKTDENVLVDWIDWVVWTLLVVFLLWVLSAAVKLIVSGSTIFFVVGMVAGLADVWLLRGSVLLAWRSVKERETDD